MIIKRRVTRQFVQLDNALVRDRKLSLDEHGMLHYLLSLPDDWEVSQAQCAKFWGIGRDKCRRIFRALRKSGWAQLERLQSEEGVFIGARWIIGDEPGPEPSEDALREEESREASEEGEEVRSDKEATAAPESQDPDALASADHATPKPCDGLPVARVNHATEKASHGRIQTLNKDREETNTLPPYPPRPAEAPPGAGDDDEGVPAPRFGELLRQWPAENVVSAFACERVYARFTDRQKRQAVAGIKPYLADVRAKGQTRLCDLRTYLDERRFERFAAKAAAAQTFYTVKRGTAQAQRWREHLALHEPAKLRMFDECMRSNGAYTTLSEWPPPKDPGAGARAPAQAEPPQARQGEDADRRFVPGTLCTQEDLAEFTRTTTATG